MKKIVIALGLSSVLLAGAAAAQELTGTLKKIKDSGKIVMGVRDSSSPLSFTLGAGKYAGFHVELCEKAIDAIKNQLKMPKLAVEYMPVTS
jgi:glutamate/aspartate transport system substrate-binding protein